MQNIPQPASKQIEQLQKQLLDSYVKKQTAKEAVKAEDEKIKAIRNVLADIPLGVFTPYEQNLSLTSAEQ